MPTASTCTCGSGTLPSYHPLAVPCYGVDLYVWKRYGIDYCAFLGVTLTLPLTPTLTLTRYGIDYRAILGVTHSHNYHSVMRGSFNPTPKPDHNPNTLTRTLLLTILPSYPPNR